MESPIDGIDTLIVAADDGTVFRVSPVFFGGPNAPYPAAVRLRWAIDRLSPARLDEVNPRMSFVGPPIQPDRSPDAVQRLVNDWWELKKGLGQTTSDT